MSKFISIALFSFSVSKYDFYVDSLLDEMGPQGLTTTLITGVFKEGNFFFSLFFERIKKKYFVGVPVDFKVKITDYDEKVTFFEEEIKKAEIPKELKSKERLVTPSVK
jgi:hypothetical protein